MTYPFLNKYSQTERKTLINGVTGNPFSWFDFTKPEPELTSTCLNYFEKWAQNLFKSQIEKSNDDLIKNINLRYENIYHEDPISGNKIRLNSKNNCFELAININTLRTIFLFFNTMVDKGHIFNNFLDDELNIGERCRVNIHIKDTNSYSMIYHDNKKLTNLAEILSMLTIKYIIGHEIGHAINKHLHFYDKFKEITDKEHQNHSELRQTMEIDADFFSVKTLIEEIKSLDVTQEPFTSFISFERRFNLLFYVIHSWFFICRPAGIFGEVDWEKDYKMELYPIKPIRENLILHYIIKNLNDEININLPFDGKFFSQLESDCQTTVLNFKDFYETLDIFPYIVFNRNEVDLKYMEVMTKKQSEWESHSNRLKKLQQECKKTIDYVLGENVIVKDGKMQITIETVLY